LWGRTGIVSARGGGKSGEGEDHTGRRVNLYSQSVKKGVALNSPLTEKWGWKKALHPRQQKGDRSPQKRRRKKKKEKKACDPDWKGKGPFIKNLRHEKGKDLREKKREKEGRSVWTTVAWKEKREKRRGGAGGASL